MAQKYNSSKKYSQLCKIVRFELIPTVRNLIKFLSLMVGLFLCKLFFRDSFPPQTAGR